MTAATVRLVGLAGPRPWDRVWTRREVDHAKVPGQQVTVCGVEMPGDSRLQPPVGVWCPVCFGGAE